MTTPWFISLIHELILEDRWISVKSIAEHLTWAGWVHNSWRFGHAEALREVGPEMPERGSKTSTVLIVSTTYGIFLPAPNNFLSGAIGDHGRNLLYLYDPETKHQSMEWRQSCSLSLKFPESKNSLEKFSPRFFGIKTASSSLIIFQRAKLSTRSITHLCWCNWGTF